MDIKSYPSVSLQGLADMIDNSSEYTWIAVMNAWKDHIYNGIIITPPKNPILFQCIQHITENVLNVDREYHLFCRYLLKLCIDEYGNDVMKAPTKVASETSTLIFLQEFCDHNTTDSECQVHGRPGGAKLDQFNLCCNARDSNGNVVFGIRDPFYPYQLAQTNLSSTCYFF